jgi:hypothetical protein
MDFLDTALCFCIPSASKCTTLTYRDFFKLMLPVGWMAIAVMAAVSYIIVPTEPRWESASVVALSAVSGIGLCLATYGFHRHASTYSIESNYSCAENEDMTEEGREILMIVRREMRKQSLRTHAVLSSIMALISISLAIFFGVFASEQHMCTHEVCGADVTWCGLALFVSTLWAGVTYLGYRDLRNVLRRTAERRIKLEKMSKDRQKSKDFHKPRDDEKSKDGETQKTILSLDQTLEPALMGDDEVSLDSQDKEEESDCSSSEEESISKYEYEYSTHSEDEDDDEDIQNTDDMV